MQKIAELYSRFSANITLVLKEGWQFLPRNAFKLASDTGFDDILIKVIDGQEHFIIMESKGGAGALECIQGVGGQGRIKQMSEPWVRDVLRRMKTHGKKDLADRIETALDAGRVEGRICWTDISPTSTSTRQISYRFYGPNVPQALKARYETASRW
jgi:hypothetical protein